VAGIFTSLFEGVMLSGLLPFIRNGNQRVIKPILLAVYVLIVSVLLYSLFADLTYDDPFITYRYAQNLHRGLGFVYNPNERVLSTTTPLFTLILAVLDLFGSDLPHLANLIGAFSLAIGGAFLWDLGRTWDSPFVSWAGLLLYPTFSLLIVTLGSESTFYLALCLGVFALYARRHYRMTALLASLAVLTRADGVLMVVVLGLDYLFQAVNETESFQSNGKLRRGADILKRIPWKAVFLFLVLTFAWYLFAWVYFGSPFPATLATKQHQAVMAISQRFASGFLGILGWYRPLWQYWISALLAVMGIVWAFWKQRRWPVFLIWPIIYFVAYSLLGVSSYFWYYAPLAPGFVVAIGLGLSWISMGVKKGLPQSFFGVPRVFGMLAAGMLLLLAILQVGQLGQVRQNINSRYRIYHAIGWWLSANTPPDASIGALEVGIIGYYAHRPMVDFAGLIQPDVAAEMRYDTTYEDTAVWAVERYHPDYLVLASEGYGKLKQAYVNQSCQPLVRFPGDAYGFEQDFQIYDCQW
jgi:hypothetical protein